MSLDDDEDLVFVRVWKGLTVVWLSMCRCWLAACLLAEEAGASTYTHLFSFWNKARSQEGKRQRRGNKGKKNEG